MSRAPYQSRFRPVVLAAIDYRDAETDAEWRAARVALAVAVVRWWESIDAATGIEVLNLPTVAECERWRQLVDAVIEFEAPPDSSTISGWQPSRGNNCAAWHRLHHAAGRWAVVALVRFVQTAEGVSHAA